MGEGLDSDANSTRSCNVQTSVNIRGEGGDSLVSELSREKYPLFPAETQSNVF